VSDRLTSRPCRSRPRYPGRGRRLTLACVLVGVLALAAPRDTHGQRRPRGGSTWSNAGEIYWGGSINVRYGRTSGIGLYPMIGYKITAQWSVGARVGYEYWWRERFAETVASNAFSGSLFTRYRLIPQIYAHAEGGAGNYDRVLFTGESDRVTYPFLFVGGGFSQQTGRRSWLMLEILYEVIQDTNSPYDGGGPVIAIGIGVGF